MSSLINVAKFVNDAAGLEKTLRLFHALAILLAALAVGPKQAQPWANASDGIGLARRFFRLLKWIDCSATAVRIFQEEKKRESGVRKLLRVAEMGFLSIYLFMEMFTITDALGMTATVWPGDIDLQLESLKFWGYAIAASILISVHDLLSAPPSAPAPSPPAANTGSKSLSEKSDAGAENVKVGEKPAAPATDRKPTGEIYKQLVMDCADFVVPTTVVGWYDFGNVAVGTAMVISTLLSMQDIWKRTSAQPF